MAVLEVTNGLSNYFENINNRRITMLWPDFLLHHDFQGHIDETITNSRTIQQQTIQTMQNIYPQLADYLSSWFSTTTINPVTSTSRIGTNVSVAIHHSLMYTAPSTERLQSIIATTTNQIINADAFCRTSTQFYKQHPDGYLITPTIQQTNQKMKL
ncbi:unnamed protein product [Ambrosiozyma monospora]|uniref:Unnamed protein product n=1 Tax=Ambrosiozyma monospora TaxID=43982 RepID=A0A9W6Z857_AMBMO|nr:unnamed protein product [Ambrosiozyma monospora]